MSLSISSHKRQLLKGLTALFLTASFVNCAMAGELLHRPTDNTDWPQNLIRAVQSKLNELGFDAGSADGIVGPKTRAAISAYQQQHNLPVDGQISNELLKALGFEQQ